MPQQQMVQKEFRQGRDEEKRDGGLHRLPSAYSQNPFRKRTGQAFQLSRKADDGSENPKIRGLDQKTKIELFRNKTI